MDIKLLVSCKERLVAKKIKIDLVFLVEMHYGTKTIVERGSTKHTHTLLSSVPQDNLCV